MNTNKKDVNDYFKYLRLYYIALAKKKKKELEEKKKNEEELLIRKKHLEEELIINRKKVTKSTPIAVKTKETLKEPNNIKITKKTGNELILAVDCKDSKRIKDATTHIEEWTDPSSDISRSSSPHSEGRRIDDGEELRRD